MRIFISAGEPSGDLHGANLIEAIRARVPEVEFVGFGGPEKPADIMPFLRNVVVGRGIPDERLHAVEHHYLDVGGRSPYNELTERQRAGVERALRARGIDLPVYCGMRNWDPLLKDVIAPFLPAIPLCVEGA